MDHIKCYFCKKYKEDTMFCTKQNKVILNIKKCFYKGE